MTMLRIAPLAPADADEVARLQDDLWRATYADLLPAWVLDARDEADNIQRWRERAAAHAKAGRSSEGARTLVAHDESGVPIGWASTGPPRDADPPTDTELWSLYLASEYQGSGIADQLLEAVLPSPAPGHLWVLAGNERAIAFYRKAAFVPDGAIKRDPRLDVDELRMVRTASEG